MRTRIFYSFGFNVESLPPDFLSLRDFRCYVAAYGRPRAFGFEGDVFVAHWVTP